MKIVLHGHIRVPNEDLDAVREALDEHIRLTRAEEGCLVFDVTAAADDPHRFDVFEKFVDRAAFERHQARIKGSRWGEVTANVERFYDIEEVE